MVVGERLDAEHATVGVQRGGDVYVQMGVDSADDRTRLYDGHSHPFSVQVVKGWHARPGKETVTIGLRQQTDRSPSGTGRAHVCTHDPIDKHLNVAMHRQVRPKSREPLTVATIGTAMVDHHQSTPPSSLGNLCECSSSQPIALATHPIDRSSTPRTTCSWQASSSGDGELNWDGLAAQREHVLS